MAQAHQQRPAVWRGQAHVAQAHRLVAWRQRRSSSAQTRVTAWPAGLQCDCQRHARRACPWLVAARCVRRPSTPASQPARQPASQPAPPPCPAPLTQARHADAPKVDRQVWRRRVPGASLQHGVCIHARLGLGGASLGASSRTARQAGRRHALADGQLLLFACWRKASSTTPPPPATLGWRAIHSLSRRSSVRASAAAFEIGRAHV